MPQSIILLLTLCLAAGCIVLGSSDADHLDMLQRGAASLESVEHGEAATWLEGSSSIADGHAGAPATACKRRCQRKYDKFVKKGKERQGVKRTCKKSFCAGCDFCAEKAPAPAPAPEEEPEEETAVDEPETPAPPAPAPAEAGDDEEVGPAPAPAPAPVPEEELPDGEEEEDADEEDDEEADVDEDEVAPSPAPAPKKFTKVEENRYWACPRKGLGNLHGFGHRTVQECFAATLKDPACKGRFDYNQRYNGQCKCVIVGGCTGLRGLGGYVTYKVDDA